MFRVEADPGVPISSKWRSSDSWVSFCLNDLFFLSKVILHHGKNVEYRDLNWIHRELCDFLDEGKNPIKQLLVLMGRDMLKSSIARALIIQWFLKKRVKNNQGKSFIASGIFDLAQDSLERVIKEILENELLQGFFSRILPNSKSDFEVCAIDKGRVRYKGVEIDLGSPEKSLTGLHFELGINDNLCNELNTRTPEMRKRTIKFWQQQESILAEDAREVVFETPWAIDDVSGIILNPEGKFDYSKIRRKPGLSFVSDTGFAVFSAPAVMGEGEIGVPSFPEKLNEEYLKRKRQKQGTYLYSALYELQPTPDEEIILRREWWDVHYDKLPVPFIRNLCIDAAGTKGKKSSYTGISIGEWDQNGTLHICYASRRRVYFMELVSWILELVDLSAEEGRPITYIGIEKEKYGEFLAAHLVNKRSDLIVSLIPLHGEPRGTRHDVLIPYYEQRKILSATGLTQYEDELKTYYKNKDTGCDIIDSIYLQTRIKLLPEKMRGKEQYYPLKEEDEDPAFDRQINEDFEQGSFWEQQISEMF